MKGHEIKPLMSTLIDHLKRVNDTDCPTRHELMVIAAAIRKLDEGLSIVQRQVAAILNDEAVRGGGTDGERGRE
jgi:hypothetical protein